MIFRENQDASALRGRCFCAFCGAQTTEILDYGAVALAGAFLKPEQFESEKRYPLRLHFCEACYVLQVPDRIAKETLFTDYFYRTSAIGTMRQHFERYAYELVLRLAPKNALEIGCNDGVLLRQLRALGVEAIGIDPANVAPDDLPIISGYWPEAIEARDFDLIIANNVFAHIDNIHGATRAVEKALTANGVFAFEVNALDKLITDLQYDWVYHEHLYYYSLIALDKHLARHGLMVFDLQRLATHAGSIRYFACRMGSRTPTKTVMEQRNRELWIGLDRLPRFHEFAVEALRHRIAMREAVGAMGRLAGYGACGRANTLLQFCDIRVDYIVDDAPAKHGFYTPGTHIPIVPCSELKGGDPILVFAWSFLQEIQPKTGGHDLLIPLPHIYTVNGQKRAIA